MPDFSQIPVFQVDLNSSLTAISVKLQDGNGNLIDSTLVGLERGLDVVVLNPVQIQDPIAVTQSTTPWITDGSAVTQPISAASLPLPSGAATSALQVTGNTSLSSIDGKLNSLGQKAMSGSVPVVIASDQTITITPSTAALPTYGASVNFTIAANSTDVFTITGSATKTIKIRKLQVSGVNSGNTNALVLLVKRSTANSGGTSTTATNVPYDSTEVAATAVVRSYTANPTTGTLVGQICSRYMFMPLIGSSNPTNIQMWDFGVSNDKPLVLRGTSEVFAVNFNGATITGTTILACCIEWTEE